MKILGIHHITAITSDAQTNIDFYTGLLGLRLVKVTVNFDDPGSYHLYYGDASGKPGSALTFFVWPGAHRGTANSSHVTATSFAVAAGSLSFWQKRLTAAHVPAEKLANCPGIIFRDPDGMNLEIIEHEVSNEFTSWKDSDVPVEYAIRGFAGATLSTPRFERSADLLTTTLEFQQSDKNTFGFKDSKAFIRLIETELSPSRIGAGVVHHIAFRVANDEEQVAWLEKVNLKGLSASPVIDRSYFHSVYFREPSGVLFELATDEPGFATDEAQDKLGMSLSLPPWMEERRAEISKALPKLTLPLNGLVIP